MIRHLLTPNPNLQVSAHQKADRKERSRDHQSCQQQEVLPGARGMEGGPPVSVRGGRWSLRRQAAAVRWRAACCLLRLRSVCAVDDAEMALCDKEAQESALDEAELALCEEEVCSSAPTQCVNSVRQKRRDKLRKQAAAADKPPAKLQPAKPQVPTNRPIDLLAPSEHCIVRQIKLQSGRPRRVLNHPNKLKPQRPKHQRLLHQQNDAELRRNDQVILLKTRLKHL